MSLSSSASCCAQLSTSLGLSQVSYPNSSLYTTTESSYWSLQEAALVPACIVSPRSADDVATAVSITTGGNCQFAIKGGTHAPAAGFANSNGGITIDMSGLDDLELSADHSVVSVGAGLSWLDVYAYLDPYNLSVAGGRNGAVGVGGLLLGGGISHYTTRVGWACDNVVNYQVVLANGSLTSVNATSDPGLLRALRGGGNNFGVVTRFDLATIPQGNISITSLAHDVSHRIAVFDAFTNLTTAKPFDPYVSLVTAFIFNATSKMWAISNSAVYTKPIVNPPVFKELKSIPSLSNKTTIEKLSVYANETKTPPLNWFFWTGTYAASSKLMSQTFDILNETLYDFNIPGGVTWSIAFEPFPTIISSYAALKGGDSLRTSTSDGNGFIVLISPLWPNSSYNVQVEQTARSAGAKIDALAASQNMLHPFTYLNYADTSQDPLRSYGNQSYANLCRASRKYDPKGVFQKNVPGGFKLKNCGWW